MTSLDHFRETYLTECAELLAEMERLLLDLTPGAATRETLDAIFRCAHSIKGGAGAFGFIRVMAFTHALESLLDQLRTGKQTADAACVTLLLQAADMTSALLRAEAHGEALEAQAEQGLLTLLKDKADTGAAVAEISAPPAAADSPAENRVWDIDFTPHPALYLSGNDPLRLFRALAGLGALCVTAQIGQVPHLQEYQPEDAFLRWALRLEGRITQADIEEVFGFVDGLCTLSILPAARAKSAATPADESAATESGAAKKSPADLGARGLLSGGSIRVDLEKIDRMVNMVGELVITQAMLHAQLRHLPPEAYPDLHRGVEELTQHTRELQDSVMSVRMQPVKSLFARMPRVVRDIAQQQGKEIRLEMAGEETEVDKTIIEQLADPLMHMIRNAADHGIELPSARLAAGKPREGVIRLSAFQRGGRIVLEVIEDGAGLNPHKILAKARALGLVAADAALSDEAIAQLIFLPGFSTAEKVSNISGRGVGMDVVKRNIEAMGGNVSLASQPGKGTRFTITLPLTLAILDGMIVRVGDEHYIIPITSILETLRPRPGDVRAVPNGTSVLKVRREYVPIAALSRLFGISGAVTDPAQALVILVENNGQSLGLIVDQLVGQQQVVIKSLEDNADPVRGLSGATILGDGRVALILDIAALCALVGDGHVPEGAAWHPGLPGGAASPRHQEGAR